MLQLRLSRNLYETRANRGYVGDEKNEGIREHGALLWGVSRIVGLIGRAASAADAVATGRCVPDCDELGRSSSANGVKRALIPPIRIMKTEWPTQSFTTETLRSSSSIARE
jgi:hypothetical protein